MLVTLKDDQFCVWFNEGTHEKWKDEWCEEIPPRMRVGATVIGMLAGDRFFTKKDTLIYVGKKLITSKDGKRTRQIRMILAGGQLGFVEGYDIKNFIPVENKNVNS